MHTLVVAKRREGENNPTGALAAKLVRDLSEPPGGVDSTTDTGKGGGVHAPSSDFARLYKGMVLCSRIRAVCDSSISDCVPVRHATPHACSF